MGRRKGWANGGNISDSNSRILIQQLKTWKFLTIYRIQIGKKKRLLFLPWFRSFPAWLFKHIYGIPYRKMSQKKYRGNISNVYESPEFQKQEKS